MNELLVQYWALILIALLIGIVVAWFIFAANRKTRVEISRDAEQDPEPARRNQALIDAPPAAPPVELPPATPEGLAGVGEAVAAGALINEHEHAKLAGQAAGQRAADDLTRLKGIGPKLSALLHSLGVTSFAQIAAWTDADIDRVDAQLGNFQGRVRRDNWVEQAGFLAKDDTEGFQSRFGAL
jgi:predicted flap endonuclease-1-like 5' DNA nuclease